MQLGSGDVKKVGCTGAEGTYGGSGGRAVLEVSVFRSSLMVAAHFDVFSTD